MCQEDEQGIWKSVLGALFAASAILTIVGNLVFSPKSPQLPTLNVANSGLTNIDRSKSLRSAAQSGLQVGKARRIQPATAAEVRTKTDDKVLATPDVIQSHELPKSPCDSTSDVARAEPALPTEPQGDEEISTGPADLPAVDLPKLPDETASPVLVAEQSPVIEQPPLPDPAAQAGDSNGSLHIVAAPTVASSVEGQALPAESGPAVAADERSASPATPVFENCELRPHAVAADNPPSCVVVQKLSHYERKLLRKIAHLEKKQNRLFKNECALVCR